jgi:hypothetical protein
MFIMLITVSAANGQNIEYVGSTLWSGIWNFRVEGDYAYCAFFNGLVILNVSDSSQPNLVSELYLQGTAYDLDISGNYAYIADGFSGMKVVDISDVSVPILVGG